MSESAEFLMRREDYDPVLLGHYEFLEYIPGVQLFIDFVEMSPKGMRLGAR